jgi:hypothetical protein
MDIDLKNPVACSGLVALKIAVINGFYLIRPVRAFIFSVFYQYFQNRATMAKLNNLTFHLLFH